MKARSTPKLDLSIWREIGRVLYLPPKQKGAAAMSSTIKIKAPEPLKFSLLKAAINCEHHITGEVIRLVHDPEAPGHNALNQLGNRLDAEVWEQLAARDAQWQEMYSLLLDELRDAATSLETISRSAGKRWVLDDAGSHVENYLQHPDQIRGYAASRAAVARSALSAITEEQK